MKMIYISGVVAFLLMTVINIMTILGLVSFGTCFLGIMMILANFLLIVLIFNSHRLLSLKGVELKTLTRISEKLNYGKN